MEIGVPLIDEAVGGVTAGLPLVVEADQGAGRNVLFLQLIHGALARGEQVVFLSAEPPTLLLHQGAAMQIDLETPLRDERLILLEMDPAIASTLRVNGADALVEAIRECAPRATFLALNPLSTMSAEILDEPQLRNLVRTLQEDWKHSHLVMGVETDMLEQSAGLRRILLSSCGAYVRAQRKYGPHCALQVERLRVGAIPDAPIPFRISRLGTEIEGPDAFAQVEDAAYVRPIAAEVAASLPVVAPPSLPVAAPEAAPVPPTQLPAPTHAAPSLTPAPTHAAPAPADPTGAEPTASAVGQPTILIIDDDALAREMTSDWLKDRYRIVSARDGSEGLATFMTQRPDLILLDLEMPKVSGFEVLRALSGASEWTPIVVISGRIRRPLDRVRPFLLGAADVIGKPPERFDLVRRVDALIHMQTPPPDILEFAMLRDDESSSSLLEEGAFRRRLERAVLIARRFDIGSTLLSLEVSVADTLDPLLAIADEELRIEDGIHAVSDTRGLILLVGSPRDGSAIAVGRLCESLERRGLDPAGCAGQFFEVQAHLDLGTWSDFYKELLPWLDLRASS